MKEFSQKMASVRWKSTDKVNKIKKTYICAEKLFG